MNFSPRRAVLPSFVVAHDVVCLHRVEVEVLPPRATLSWQDERWIDPLNTQLRFEAIVYNAEGGVTWQVYAPDGGPGAGQIDATGLYRAPDKGSRLSGTTDVVVATARADSLRKASAWVTLVGLGPLPAPDPTIEIWPKRTSLYYHSGIDNAYIDPSNMQQLFRAYSVNSPGPQVRWTVNGAVQAGTEPWFLYEAPNAGVESLVTIRAQLLALLTVQDDAKVTLLNYDWPGV